MPQLQKPPLPAHSSTAHVQDFIRRWPYLTSPAALAYADTNGNWVCRPHHDLMNRALLRVAGGQTRRLGIHIPFQHGKTTLCSEYYVAWRLLLDPTKRFILGSHSASFSEERGANVREIIKRHGGPFNVHLRDDSNAKGTWRIHSANRAFDGGMICRGWGAGVQGRPADEFLLDDTLENSEQAMSTTIKDKIWEWYTTVVFGRLGPGAPVINVCTRWAKDDLAGRLYREQPGRWEILNIKAVAEENDILGRKPGEPLWPERVPLSQLLERKKIGGRFWYACWQQAPQEDSGLLFRPLPMTVDGEHLPGWPHYLDVGDAWRMRVGAMWQHYRKQDCSILLACDWSLGKKKTSDFTAFVVAAWTPDGKVLVLSVLNQRLRDEQRASTLDRMCALWSPGVVVMDNDMISETMLTDFRRYPHIPEPRLLPIGNKAKRVRAMAAVIHGENGRIFLPADEEPWQREFCDQLAGFTGEDGAVDDMADALGIVGRSVDSIKPNVLECQEWPEILVAGKAEW
jgi:hypothetical protein